jgi:hypothetical protein
MLKKIILTVILITSLLMPNIVYAQSVEMSKEFKEVLEAVAREEFRNFLFAQIAKNDPCMAIVTYDLLGEIITSKDYKGIKDLIINSSVDYLFLINTKSQLEKYLEVKENEKRTFTTRSGKPVKLSGETREKFISYSALYWYSVQRQNNYLPVQLPLYELLKKHKDEYDLKIASTTDKPGEIWTKRLLRQYVKTSFERGIDVREAEYYKHMIIELMQRQDKWEERVLSAYQTIQTAYKEYEDINKSKKDSAKEANTENQSYDTAKTEEYSDKYENAVSTDSSAEFKRYENLTSTNNIIDKFKKDFEKRANKIMNKVKIDVSNMNPNMIFSVSYTYINNLLYYSNEFNSRQNDQKMVDEIFEMLSKSEQHYSENKLFKIKFGLWVGVFSNGPEWLDENGKRMDYPITQLKINDRFQVSPFPIKAKNTFVYVGGITDTLFGNLLNKNSKTFVYAGIGYQYKQFAFCYSVAEPSNFHDQPGSVASIMYDIDLARIVRILRK